MYANVVSGKRAVTSIPEGRAHLPGMRLRRSRSAKLKREVAILAIAYI